MPVVVRMAYDAERDGWLYQPFHDLVDGYGATVIIAQTEGGAVVGGYNPSGAAPRPTLRIPVPLGTQLPRGSNLVRFNACQQHVVGNSARCTATRTRSMQALPNIAANPANEIAAGTVPRYRQDSSNTAQGCSSALKCTKSIATSAHDRPRGTVECRLWQVRTRTACCLLAQATTGWGRRRRMARSCSAGRMVTPASAPSSCPRCCGGTAGMRFRLHCRQTTRSCCYSHTHHQFDIIPTHHAPCNYSKSTNPKANLRTPMYFWHKVLHL
jgi:hypothetical protein